MKVGQDPAGRFDDGARSNAADWSKRIGTFDERNDQHNTFG